MPDPEMAGIVRDNHRVAEETMMADGSPDACFCEHADRRSIENVDALASQVFQERRIAPKLCSVVNADAKAMFAPPVE